LINANGSSFWDRPWNLKVAGTYEAPFNILLSGFFRVQSGQPFPRVIQVRNLNQGTVNVYAEPVGERRLPTVTTLDLRCSKNFDLLRGRLGLSLDVFNVMNANTVLAAQNLSGPAYMTPTALLAPRIARLGISYQF
jgi:hypothetical protein